MNSSGFVENIRVLIVDDEPLARERLRTMLGMEAGINIVGEAESGPAAINAIQEHSPDVVFLDLQMHGCNGIKVVAEIPESQRPVIVVVTAHDDYAVDAFRVGVVDFLLKPFDRKRLRTALQRTVENLRARRVDVLEARVKKVLSDVAASGQKRRRIAVKSKGRVVFVEPDEIQRVEAADNYVMLHLLRGDRMMMRCSLTAMEKRLGSAQFVRVNRSTLVQLRQIRELRSNAYGDYTVVLYDGTQAPLGRNFRGSVECLRTPDS